MVTGKEYEQALTEFVLAPAGMTETGYTAPDWDPRRIAHGYQNGSDWGTIVERISGSGRPYWALRGNGGLGTTLGDFAKWDAALRDNRVLTDSSLRKYLTGYVDEGPGARSRYGYGWAVVTTPRNTRLVMHNGGNGIFVAEWLRYVDEGISIFIASSNAEMTATAAVGVVTRIAFGLPYELPPQIVAANPAALAPFTGTWKLPSGGRITLRLSDRGVLADAAGQDAWSLLHMGDTSGSPRAAELNASARVIVNALVNGDARPLAGRMDGGPPIAEIERQEAQLLTSRKARWGELVSVEVLGTVRQVGMGEVTTVRLAFQRGAATNIYVWGLDGRIGDVRAQPYESLLLPPVAADEVVVLGSGAAALARLRVEGGTLVIATGGRSILAVKED
jgi:hypothetical protein